MKTPDSEFNLRFITLVSIAAALGGLLFGYDFVVIGGAKPFYELYFHLTTGTQIGWANSCALLGCLAGSILAGSLTSRLGRKGLLIVSAVLFGVSSVLTGWASVFPAFIFWRILGGVAIGIASNVSPTYIAEVSPPAWRGRLVSLNQLMIVTGILLAQLVNLGIAREVKETSAAGVMFASWNVQMGWRYMFAAVAIPSVLFLISSILVPESPRWLVLKGRDEEAISIFTRIRDREYGVRAVEEVRAMIAQENAQGAGKASFTHRKLRRFLLIGIALAVLQQWTGINVLFNYAQEIFRSAGYGINDVLFNIVITGAVNLFFTLLAFPVVDRLGRRTLMLLGCAGLALSHLLIGICYSRGVTGIWILLLVLLTIGCFAMSLAPVTWILIAELFPIRYRATGVATSISALWIACFLLTFSFPLLQGTLGTAGTFWLYGAICASGFALVYFFVPETEGKSLEEIERELGWGVTESSSAQPDMRVS